MRSKIIFFRYYYFITISGVHLVCPRYTGIKISHFTVFMFILNVKIK